MGLDMKQAVVLGSGQLLWLSVASFGNTLLLVIKPQKHIVKALQIKPI